MYEIYPQKGHISSEMAQEAKNFLSSRGIKSALSDNLSGNKNIISIGDDKHFLETFSKIKDNAVMCVGTGATVLSDITPINYLKYLGFLAHGKWFVQEKKRLKTELKGTGGMSALNDILVFPSKSAQVMRYSLSVGGNEMWADSADGIIIATPTGSTAYNLSAGGSAILDDARVFSIVPVNSISRERPLIVPDDLQIHIRIHSDSHVRVILDGGTRMRLNDDLLAVSRSGYPAKFIRCKKQISFFSQVRRKGPDIISPRYRIFSPTSKYILKMIMVYGPMTQKEIIHVTGLPVRTVRDGLSSLLTAGAIEKGLYARDVRQSVYRLVD